MQTPMQTSALILQDVHNPGHNLGPMHILDASLRALVVLVLSLTLCSPVARAQQTSGAAPPQPVIPGMTPVGPEPDPNLRHMTQQMALKRNAERQQQIVKDTANLLQLAQELNADVSKSDKDTLSVSVVKKADQIEKLAKTIKDKMRDAQ